jgi:DNA polymerase III delta prime subunit
MSISQKELYDRLTDLESQKLTLTADINQLKADSKYDEDTNPQGLAKEDIKNIHGASKLKAKDDFLEKKEAADAVFKKYQELTEDNGV